MTEVGVAWAEECLGRRVVTTTPLLGGRTSTMLVLRDEAGGSSVLRLITEEPWRTHGEGLAQREHEIQSELAATGVPAPRSLALDATGAESGTGVAAHLMTLLPGRTDLTRHDDASLDAMADLLATIHDVRPTTWPRDYQPWAWPAKYVVPRWAADPGPWRAAFALLEEEPPAYDPTFLHRDFGPHNLLWDGPTISGVVDWVETSTGPAWLDVAHCSTNLALHHGNEVADAFATAYAARTGRTPAPWWDVMDVVGFLPPPGRPDFTDDPAQLAALDARLRLVMRRLPNY